MKIHKLRLGNLNSLVAEWEIDFSDKAFQAHSIFAITGPTGAGKTTILDGICLALYGMTPRLSKINQSNNEIMSRHCAYCFAELEFETHKGIFRAYWSQRRARNKAGGKLQAYKHEISDAINGKVLESKASLVPELVREISGMDFEQFTRAILLAQGGFAAFLQASADERAPILEQITGTEIYTLISRKVHERSREEKNELEGLKMLGAGIQVLSEEEESSLVRQLELQEEEKKTKEKRKAALEQELKCQANIFSLERELALLNADWEDFQQRKDSFEPNRQRLELARKALLLDGPFAALCSMREQQERDNCRCNVLLQELPEQSRRREDARKEVEQLTAQVGKLKEKLRRELEIIKVVRELDLQLRQGEASVKQYQGEMEAYKRKIEQILKEKEDARKKLEQYQTELEECQEYLKKHQADQSLISNLTGINKSLLRYLNQASQLEGANRELRKAEKQRLLAQEECQEQDRIYENLQKELKSLEVEWEVLKGEIKSLSGERDYPSWLVELQGMRERRTLLESLELLINQKDDSLQKQDSLHQELMALEEKEHSLADEIPLWIKECKHYEQDVERLQTQIQLLSRIRDLEEERQHLQDGQPCPLCGSPHHPYAQGQIPLMDQSEKELRQARIALKQAQQELSSRELEQGRVMTEKKLLSRSLQEEKAAYAKLDQQYQEKLGHSGLKLPDKDTTLYIKKLLQELQSSIAGLKTTIAQLEEKQEKERELKTSLESMKTAVLEAERICQQRVTEHTVSLHQEEEAGRMAGAIQDELHALQREIMLELAPYGIDPLQMPDVDSIKKQLKQRQEAWIRQEKRKERLEQEIRLMDQVIKQQEMQLKNNYKEQEDLGCKLEKSEESHKRLKQSRLDLYGVRNPDDEEARIQDQLASSEKELDLAKEDFMARDSHLKQMQEQLEELQAGIEERKPLLVQREEEFRLNLKSYGFTDEKDYMLACLPEDEQRQLVQQVDELSREETELQTRCHDKRKALKAEKEKQQSEYSREELELELSQCEKVLEELDKSIITAQLKLENNQSKQGRLKKLKEQIEKQKKEYHRWELLDHLIGSHDGKRYRNFAQGVSFDLMIAYANRQLRKMSDRYLLIRDNRQSLALNVIDNYQAGEIRSTKNLSGGESFLVSLSLALGLSSMASQKVRVDSLFLDEGFGALDDEALDTALNTLASLEQDGKMIGVISHVPALKERISTQIQVIPQSGGRSILKGPGCRLIG